MSVTVILEAQLRSDSADSYAGVHDTLEETRAFAGAISLEVFIDNDDHSRVMVIETWESVEAHDRYTAWRAGDGVPTKLIAVLAAPPTTRVFSSAPEL